MSSTENRKKNENSSAKQDVQMSGKESAQSSGKDRVRKAGTGKKAAEKSRKTFAIKQIRRFARKHKGFLVCAAVAVLAAFLISKCLVQLVLIRDASMEPAYHSGQIVAVSKLRHDYQIGDVIVFDAPQLNCRLVKRIVHVPGDHLSPEEAAVYGRGTLAGYTLPEGAYLVLGDNADESVDSRDSRVGVVSERQIVGVLLR